jgi:peptide/nickel transport system substrate-binding protein
MTDEQALSRADMLARQGVSRRRVLAGLGATVGGLALSPLLAACGAAGSSGAPTTDGTIETLNWAVDDATLVSLDAAKSTAPTDSVIYMPVLETLMTLDSAGRKLVPLLAETVSRPTAYKWIFMLRSGIKFSDGSPLTVDDVVFCMKRHMDPALASQINPYYLNVASIVGSGNTVTVTMKTPDPLFESALYFTGIAPRAFIEKMGNSFGGPGSTPSIIGTGPYKLKSFPSNTSATLERNPSYWGARPKVANVTFTTIGDQQTARLALGSGQIDGMFAVSPNEAASYGSLSNARLYSSVADELVYLSFNVTAAPWNDIHVRRAMAYAADKDGIVHAFLEGYGRVADSLTGEDEMSSLVGAAAIRKLYDSLPSYPYSLAMAKQELQQSAHAGGFTASVNVPSSLPEYVKALVSYGQGLQTMGITLNVNQVPLSTWIAEVSNETRPGIVAMSLLPDAPDPTSHLDRILPTSEIKPPGLNTASYSNPRVDQLLTQQAKVVDSAQRAAEIGEVLTIVGQDLPYLPLYFSGNVMAISNQYTFANYNQYYYVGNWLANVA